MNEERPITTWYWGTTAQYARGLTPNRVSIQAGRRCLVWQGTSLLTERDDCYQLNRVDMSSEEEIGSLSRHRDAPTKSS